MGKKKKWKPFYFDGNQAWGVIISKKEWERIVRAYKYDYLHLLKAKCNPHSGLPYPKFGFVVECVGPLTLGEWAKMEGMDLIIKKK